MNGEEAAKGRTIVRTAAILAAILAVVLSVGLVARPMFTDAQVDPDPPAGREPTGATGATADPDDSSPGRVAEASTQPTSGDATQPASGSGDVITPSLVYVDGSLEVASDGEFATMVDVVGAPPGSDLAVQIYDRITTVEQLEASATDLPANLLATFDTIALAETDPPDSQLSGFSISLYSSDRPRPPSAWAYRLDEPGVYPVRVRLRGPDGDQLDSFVTYLARTPDTTDTTDPPPAATEVALVARIHEDPPDGGSDTAAAVERAIDDERLLTIDEFITSITERAQLPVTISITPDTARRMSQNGSSLPTAQRLRSALVDDERLLLGAPYVDVDVPSLLTGDLDSELDAQMMLGAHNLEVALGQTGDDVWLVDRPIDQASVDALAARAVTGVVLGPEVLVDAHHSTVLVDGTESTLAGLPLFATGLDETRSGSEGAESDLLAANHAVGRLAALRGIEARGAAVAVSIDPDLDPDRLTTFLDLVEETPDHVQLTTVDRLLDDAVATQPSTLVTPTIAGDADLLDLHRSTRQRVESYRSMLAPDSPVAQEFELPLAISLDANRPVPARRNDLETISSTIDARFGAITAPERDRVTLGTRDATFPLPITTDSTEPLRVRIDIQASDRVELPRSSFETTITGERTVVQIPVRARASGDTALLITISTPDGEVVLTESRYTIRSTAVSGVGVLLTIGAGGFLAVWWGRHWHRTRKAQTPTPTPRHARTGSDPDL